jgi:hypothetical protein
MLPFKEGTWFVLPLRSGGFSVGVVARTTAHGEVIAVYLFGPKRSAIPPLAELAFSEPKDALRVIRVGDLGLIDGSWPIIGQAPHWRREEWRIPAYLRRDELSRKAWRVVYSDSDPNEVVLEEELPFDTSGMDRDAVFGTGAVELLMTKLLG